MLKSDLLLTELISKLRLLFDRQKLQHFSTAEGGGAYKVRPQRHAPDAATCGQHFRGAWRTQPLVIGTLQLSNFGLHDFEATALR